MNEYVGNNCLNKTLTMTLKSIDIEVMHFLYSWPHRKTILCITNVPANICLFKVNNRNTKKRCEIRSKLTKTPEQRHYRQWRRSGVFIINLEHISPCVSIVDFFCSLGRAYFICYLKLLFMFLWNKDFMWQEPLWCF